MWLKQSNGNSLRLHSFYWTRTYSGLLEGKPRYEHNLRVVESENMDSLWGKRKMHIIRPSEILLQTMIPPVTYFAWLTGDCVKGTDHDGAELVVKWFGDE